MSEVTMIGLGSMGSALARAVIKAGHNTTVWNRTPGRMKPLVELGARAARSAAEAVQASPVIMVCVANYAAANKFLRTEEVSKHLAGRTLIQLSTGTPDNAREAAAWLKDRGCDYLDAAIIEYPEGVGAVDTQILFGGPRATFERCRPFVSCFGGDLRHVGEQAGSAAALNLALISYFLGVYLGAIHGAHLCEAENVSADQFRALLPEGDDAIDTLQAIHLGTYADTGASLDTWQGAAQMIQDQANSTGINSEFPDLIHSLCKRAVALGFGDEDVAAIVKVLRDGSHL